MSSISNEPFGARLCLRLPLCLTHGVGKDFPGCAQLVCAGPLRYKLMSTRCAGAPAALFGMGRDSRNVDSMLRQFTFYRFVDRKGELRTGGTKEAA